MKKKILSFLFAICLIIPCAFMLTACGDNPSSEDPAQWKIVTEATCTTDGLKKRTINGVEEEEVISALGHNYGDWSVTLNETCTTNGSQQKTCGRCGDVQTEVILAHHTLDGTIKFDKTQHWEHCTKCNDKVNVEIHELECKSNDSYMYSVRYNMHSFVETTKDYTCKNCNFHNNKTGRVNGYYNIDGQFLEVIKNVFDSVLELDFELYALTQTKHYLEYEYFDNYYSMTGGIKQYFDSENKLTYSTIFNGTEDVEMSRFSYEDTDDGYIITQTITYNTVNATLADCYEFNNDGVLLCIYTLDLSTGEILGGSEYIKEVDNNGFIVNDNGIIYTDSQFDEFGNRIYFKKSYTNSTKPTIQTATFDSNNKILKIAISKAEQDDLSGSEYLFTHNGDKISSIIVNEKDENGDITSTKTYNFLYSDGNLEVKDSNDTVVYRISYVETSTTNITE